MSVYVCVRQRIKIYEFHSKNLLAFVFIHELTHIAANVQHHPQRFWDAFGWLLSEAVDAGLYQPTDYSKAPVEYCADALKVTYSPLFDSSLNKICCE